MVDLQEEVQARGGICVQNEPPSPTVSPPSRRGATATTTGARSVSYGKRVVDGHREHRAAEDRAANLADAAEEPVVVLLVAGRVRDRAEGERQPAAQDAGERAAPAFAVDIVDDRAADHERAEADVGDGVGLGRRPDDHGAHRAEIHEHDLPAVPAPWRLLLRPRLRMPILD
jgi:hypothetical protein